MLRQVGPADGRVLDAVDIRVMDRDGVADADGVGRHHLTERR